MSDNIRRKWTLFLIHEQVIISTKVGDDKVLLPFLRGFARFSSFESDDGVDDVVKERKQFVTGDQRVHKPFVMFALFFGFGDTDCAVVLNVILFVVYLDEEDGFWKSCHCSKCFVPCCFGGL